jgi:hypothetical protein
MAKARFDPWCAGTSAEAVFAGHRATILKRAAKAQEN